jgi:hypothetical protein
VRTGRIASGVPAARIATTADVHRAISSRRVQSTSDARARLADSTFSTQWKMAGGHLTQPIFNDALDSTTAARRGLLRKEIV